jgi:hypothetical protein
LSSKDANSVTLVHPAHWLFFLWSTGQPAPLWEQWLPLPFLAPVLCHLWPSWCLQPRLPPAGPASVRVKTAWGQGPDCPVSSCGHAQISLGTRTGPCLVPRDRIGQSYHCSDSWSFNQGFHHSAIGMQQEAGTLCCLVLCSLRTW